MKRSPLSQVENLIRRVVEEPFTWLGGGALDPFHLATHLARYYDGPANGDKLPNQFTVYVSPSDYREIEGETAVFEHQVGDYVLLMAERRGYHLLQAPAVAIKPHPQEKARSAHVVASRQEAPAQADTAVYAMQFPDATQEAIRAADAFLILQGRQHIALDRPIMRIGRRIDNDIVLDEPSISRYHAQIRWRQRYFVLYDVSSHGRTFVNGMKAQEHILHPGDVIALSDVFLVYGEGREDMLDMPAVESEEMDSTMLKPEDLKREE